MNPVKLITMRKFFTLLFSLQVCLLWAQQYNNEWINYNQTYYKFTVGAQVYTAFRNQSLTMRESAEPMFSFLSCGEMEHLFGFIRRYPTGHCQQMVTWSFGARRMTGKLIISYIEIQFFNIQKQLV